MNGKIDANGVLYIERAGRMSHARCINYEAGACSHKCAHFSEPEKIEVLVTFQTTKDGMGMVRTTEEVTHVALCHGKTLVFKTFVDERNV